MLWCSAQKFISSFCSQVVAHHPYPFIGAHRSTRVDNQSGFFMDLSKFWRRFSWHKLAGVGRMSRAAVPRSTSHESRGGPQESRVGPRAAAWVEGQWHKAQYLAPAGGGFSALELGYGLYIPPGSASRALPLVVMLHGCTQTSEAFARGTRMNVLADRYGFAVLYPEQTAQRHPQACWHWYDTAAAGGTEAHAIVALVGQLVAQHGFDGSRIYAAGLSAGAAMATMLAFDYPERFAAVAAHSGVVFGAARSVPSALDAMRRGTTRDPAEVARAALPGAGHPGMPALLLHGERDEMVSPLNLDQLETEFLVLNGLVDEQGTLVDVTLAVSEHESYRQRVYRRAGRDVVKIYRVAELGHAWSGGDDTVPFHAGIGPDASEEIWAFFSQERRLPGAAAALLDAVGTL
jgi:poly(hydroxyalkanoate) depolymerase family esterase